MVWVLFLKLDDVHKYYYMGTIETIVKMQPEMILISNILLTWHESKMS